MNDWFQQVKSTIDKHGVDIAKSFDPDVQFLDLDSADLHQEQNTIGDDSIVWELATLEEDPIDPLYTVVFGIGARTMSDPGRYTMAELLGAVQAVFAKGGSINIYDFSDANDTTTKRGDMYITGVTVDPQMYDREAGIRLVLVTAKAVRAP